MTVAEWNERYRTRAQAEDFNAAPTPLLVETAAKLPPGQALDRPVAEIVARRPV